MKKYAVVLVVVGLFILVFGFSVFASDVIWQDIDRGNLNLRTVLVNPNNPQIIYVETHETQTLSNLIRTVYLPQAEKVSL